MVSIYKNQLGIIIFFLLLFPMALGLSAAPAMAQCQTTPDGGSPPRDLTLKNPNIQGTDVLKVQRELQRLNFYEGKLDGVYGPKTTNAVKEFQEENNLKPDGIVDPVTRKTLERKLGSREVASEIPEGQVDLLIDTRTRILKVLVDGEPYREFRVAVGKESTPTPIGEWGVQRKAMNWGKAFGTRWIGLNVPWGTYGIHGTNKPGSIGSYASHGCIRMHNRDVEKLYPLVQEESTRIIIIGNPFTYQSPDFRKMRRDTRGSDVMIVQRKLKERGYYDGPIDGIWGGGMEKAVIQFRKDMGMKYDDCVDNEVYKALGI